MKMNVEFSELKQSFESGFAPAQSFDMGFGEINDVSGGNISLRTDETLILRDGLLSVNTTDVVEANNTLPVTSAAVQTTVGNINALLETI